MTDKKQYMLYCFNYWSCHAVLIVGAAESLEDAFRMSRMADWMPFFTKNMIYCEKCSEGLVY